MYIIKHKSFFLLLSLIITVVSLVLTFTLGEKFSVEFTGGSSIVVRFDEGELPDKAQVEGIAREVLADPNVRVRQAGDTYTIDAREVSNEVAEQLVAEFSSIETVTEAEIDEFVSFGPSLSQELARSSLIALGLAFILITIYVAVAFRKTTWAIPSWMYGLIALIALVHDIIIPIGLYALLGIFLAVEIDILFVTALLAILGYSINDTLIIFDRIRENLQKARPDAPPEQETERMRRRNRYEEKEAEVEEKQEKTISQEELEQVVGESLSQTYGRSINTSLTTALVLLALYLIGGEATQSFSLVLLAGVLAGTYSSIFLASPLLVFAADKWRQRSKKM